MVVRNEAERFLDSCLAWNSQWCDEMHIYDGGSSDDTVKIARKYTSFIDVHPSDSVGFYEHEGQYRQAAWNALSATCDLRDGDWVFGLDADEFLVGSDKFERQNPRSGLEALAGFAEKASKRSASISRGEVWDISGIPLRVRTDGEWARDKVTRFVRWEPKGKMRDVKLGCGSVPLYGLKGPVSNVHTCSLLHFGYAIEGEAERKYGLYSGTSGNAHNPNHVASLLTKPKLAELSGVAPKWWLGEK